MTNAAKTIQDITQDIDWSKLKENYAILMMDGEKSLPSEHQETRRRLMESRTLKTKKKKVMKLKLPSVPVSSVAQRKKKKKFPSMPKGYSTTSAAMSSPSSPKSGKKANSYAPTNAPSPNTTVTSQSKKSNKSSKSSKTKYKKKCRKVKVATDDELEDVERRAKKIKYKKRGSGAKQVTRTYEYTILANTQESKSGKGKTYVYGTPTRPAISGKGKMMKIKKAKSAKSQNANQSSKSSKSQKYAIICDAETVSPSAEPSLGANNATATPSISISTMPSPEPISSPPSATPSISHMPTKFGTTQPPSVTPTVSHAPSTNRPSSAPSTNQPTNQPSAQPTISTTISPAPTLSFAPTLEDIYRYDAGNCPNRGSTGLECSDPGLRRICDRYDENGSFRACWELCKPSFCCIHDAQNNFEAPSCSTDQNCAQYAYCYIVWFKFSDTFGPATFLDIEQGGSFFDVPNSEVRGDDKFGDDFFDQLYFHHFDDVSGILNAGDVDGNFVPALIFQNPEFWQEEEVP